MESNLSFLMQNWKHQIFLSSISEYLFDYL